MRNLNKRKNYFAVLNIKLVGLIAVVCFLTVNAWANHPVFLEGNCLVPPSGSSPTITAGTCGDYDGDGRIGTAEDTDGDRVFGTIKGANGATGINNNGTITVVTSGVFAENPLNITGNVTLQAAPGVEAIIDAVLQGDPDNDGRQVSSGLFINTEPYRRVLIRNITIKNFATGIRISGGSMVVLENVKIENCRDYGVDAQSGNSLSIFNSSITSIGYRQSSLGDYPFFNTAAEGTAVKFQSNLNLNVVNSHIANNFKRGIWNTGTGSVCISNSSFINNGSNTVNSGSGSINFAIGGCYQ